MKASRGKVVMLATAGPATNIVFNALTDRFDDVSLVLEDAISRQEFLRRRVKRLGWPTVVGQMLFMGLAVPVLRRRADRRVRSILATDGLDASPIGEVGARVPSVNSAEARSLLAGLRPTVVVVNGTRIISRETLECVGAPFINMHAGITPQYRGVHGGYWALAEGTPELVGTTVHYIDTGIDTGPIIGQETFRVGCDDSFATYSYLHVAAGLPILMSAVGNVLEGNPPSPREPLSSEHPSRLRSHPTLGGYLACRVRSGIR